MFWGRWGKKCFSLRMHRLFTGMLNVYSSEDLCIQGDKNSTGPLVITSEI